MERFKGQAAPQVVSPGEMGDTGDLRLAARQQTTGPRRYTEQTP